MELKNHISVTSTHGKSGNVGGDLHTGEQLCNLTLDTRTLINTDITFELKVRLLCFFGYYL